jgi:hypothetical protein
MKATFASILCSVLLLAGTGCGNGETKPPSQAELQQFKGNPKSPGLQAILRAHMGGGPPTQAAKR